MQSEIGNDVNFYYQDRNGNKVQLVIEKLTDRTFYTSDYNGNIWHIVSEISGKTTAIELPEYIDYSVLSHLKLNTVWWGSWETPQSERVKGFQLRAISENGMNQQVENFYRDRMTDDEILEVSEGFAKYLGVELKVS